MADLAHNLPEHNVLMLWSKGGKYDVYVLLVYFVSFSAQFVLLPGQVRSG